MHTEERAQEWDEVQKLAEAEAWVKKSSEDLDFQNPSEEIRQCSPLKTAAKKREEKEMTKKALAQLKKSTAESRNQTMRSVLSEIKRKELLNIRKEQLEKYQKIESSGLGEAFISQGSLE